MIRVLIPAAFILLFLGYFRDYIFININFLSGVKYYPNIITDYKLPQQLFFLNVLKQRGLELKVFENYYSTSSSCNS